MDATSEGRASCPENQRTPLLIYPYVRGLAGILLQHRRCGNLEHDIVNGSSSRSTCTEQNVVL